MNPDSTDEATMIHTRATSTSDNPAWIELLRLTRSDWRVFDTRLDASDPHRLLGYIERLARDTYESLWIAEPIGWARFETLELARAAFADRRAFGEKAESNRPRYAGAGASLLDRVHRVRRRANSM